TQPTAANPIRISPPPLSSLHTRRRLRFQIYSFLLRLFRCNLGGGGARSGRRPLHYPCFRPPAGWEPLVSEVNTFRVVDFITYFVHCCYGLGKEIAYIAAVDLFYEFH
ncbi:hypothetical protein A2U01_0030980, partial [Trifolium medium]|nr:hypothetical protein [Trifolium medium]